MLYLKYFAAACALSFLGGCLARTAVGTVAKVGTTAVGVTAKAAVGTVKLGARGVGAVLTDNPRISKRTLADRAGRQIGARGRHVTVSDIYEDLNRTDYTATTPDGQHYNCAIIETDEGLSDAACAPI